MAVALERLHIFHKAEVDVMELKRRDDQTPRQRWEAQTGSIFGKRTLSMPTGPRNTMME